MHPKELTLRYGPETGRCCEACRLSAYTRKVTGASGAQTPPPPPGRTGGWGRHSHWAQLCLEMDSPKGLGNWTEPHPQAPLGATFHHRSYLLVSRGERCCLLSSGLGALKPESMVQSREAGPALKSRLVPDACASPVREPLSFGPDPGVPRAESPHPQGASSESLKTKPGSDLLPQLLKFRRATQVSKLFFLFLKTMKNKRGSVSQFFNEPLILK